MIQFKKFLLILWKLRFSFMIGIGGEVVFYPFGGAGENFVDESGLIAIPFNWFYFIATYWILSDTFYIKEDEKNENDKNRLYARK